MNRAGSGRESPRAGLFASLLPDPIHCKGARMTDTPHDPDAPFEVFVATAPGLEAALRAEMRDAAFPKTMLQPGGVAFTGHWTDVWRANLVLRGANRVLARIGSFRAMHLAQLDKRARRFPWSDYLRHDMPLRVEATSHRSRIYHQRAAAQRIEGALRDSLGARIDPEAVLRLMVRIDDDLCTLSIDTSGVPLHKRGHKEAVGKAPLRETLAALFLRQCGYDGSEPLVDPMCGSGTFLLEAAGMAAGLAPGRARGFAFEHLVGFDPVVWAGMRDAAGVSPPTVPHVHGFDRDAGAVAMTRANAARAGVSGWVSVAERPVGALVPPPDTRPGLVIVNPPYGARIGEPGPLRALHATLGDRLRTGFAGWRVGLVTPDPQLANATGLPFLPPGPPVPHGGIKVKLYRTDPLPG
jgi:putative N6-adenine-specific DNA methylase